MTESLSHEKDHVKADLNKRLSKMIDIFFDYCPNDPHFLAHPDSQELVEQMDTIKAKIETYHRESNEAIMISLMNHLISFNQEWFPDSIDEDLQAELKNEIDSARATLNAFTLFFEEKNKAE